MIEALIRNILRSRLLVLALLASISLAAVSGVVKLRFDNSLEIWFLEGDEGIADYKRFLELFGTDQVVLLVWECDDAFSGENLARLARLEKTVSAVPDVLQVSSLASASIPRDEVGDLAVGPLFSPPPEDPTILAARRAATLASPFMTSSLVSPDGRAVALVAEIAHHPGRFAYKRVLLARLAEIVEAERERDGTRIHLAGAAVLDRAFFDYTERDMLLFLPILLMAICAIILLLFRRLSAVAVALGVVSISLLWTLGLQGWLGWKITVVSSVLAPLLMAIGIADAIHVLSEFYDQYGRAGSRKEAVLRAMDVVWRPCLFTSLTTAAGFLSLLVSPILPVRQLGMLAALGVLLTLGVTILLVPLALSLAPAPKTAYLEQRERGAIGWLLLRLQGGGLRRARISLWVAGGLTAGAIVGLFSLDVGTNMLEFFRPDDPVRQTTERVDELIGGTISVEYLIQADGEHGFLTPERLGRLDRFADYLRKQPNVQGVHGLPEILKELDAALRGVPADQGRMPDSRPKIAQYMLLIEGNPDVQRFIKKRGQVGRFSLRVSMAGSQKLSRRVPIIDAYREQNIETPGFVLPGTGMVPLMNRMEQHLLQSQMNSFGLAVLVIGALMILLLRSFRLGLLGMVPNLAPVLLTLGVMGFAAIRLDIATVMIASVVLGLVVDDSIHLLARLQRELPAVGGDSALAVDRALATVGRPILITSLVLILGFWTLLFASFQPNIHFGLLSGAAVLAALVADLVVVPAALRVFRPRLG